ncbi:MAG: DNA polymerase III subunit delta [Myxococcales bacterium]|nr:DNA polymerase III subunit delta [Myxococcales bacterium]
MAKGDIDLEKELASGNLRPVYFLAGESYPRDRAARDIRQAALGGRAESAFNVDAFVGKEATANRVLAAARTLPMLGPRRLVQVRDAHAVPADDLKAMLPYINDPSPTTCLLMIADKIDGRAKFFRDLKKLGVLLKFEPLKERQIADWVSAEARRAKIKLGPGAAQRIAETVGSNMGELADALTRLDLYAGTGTKISRDHVDEVLASTRQHSIFELTNAVGRRDARQALQVLHSMIGARESGIRIVSMLARHLRQLWLIKEMSAAGRARDDIAQAAGVHPYFLRDMQTQSERFDAQTLSRTHRALFETDRALKSSPLPDALLLDELVMKLVAVRG